MHQGSTSGLGTGALRGVGYLFEYDLAAEAPAEEAGQTEPAGRAALIPRAATTPSPSSAHPQRSSGTLRIGFVGAGNYAASMLLPHLAKEQGVELAQVATRRSLSAVNAQRKFGFAEVSTDADTVFADDSIDAVFIVTRHSAHANLVCRALEAGKAVFVEKPLALTVDELDRILETVQSTGNDRVMVGFNRRFAPILVEMRSRFGPAAEPTNARYLVNAGRLGSDSWYRDVALEGSRFVGEGGHFVDTMSWWIGSDPTEVVALPAANPEEVQMSLRYGDGSLGTITYVTNANRRFPKETFEVSSGGKTARLDNFRRATVWTGSIPRTRRRMGAPDKGQPGEIKAFLESLRTGGAMPISLDSLTATTRATLVGRRRRDQSGAATAVTAALRIPEGYG